MASDDINLERGEPDANERRRRRRQQRTDTPPASEGFTAQELRFQLGRAFDGLVKNRETRDDLELAEAIREEGDAMTEGFVALTDNVPVLRMPLVILLNLLITLLAFGRVGGILWGRFKVRRSERLAQQEIVMEGNVPITEE